VARGSRYPAAVSSRQTLNASRTCGVHVAMRRAEMLYAPPWQQECCTQHRVVGTLSPHQNATRRGNSAVACSRLGHTERDWGPQGGRVWVVFDCMFSTLIASGEGTGRRGGGRWWWGMKENDCLDSKHEPARFLSPNRGKEQIGHANCPFWQHVMGAKSQKLLSIAFYCQHRLTLTGIFCAPIPDAKTTTGEITQRGQ
jgi:hypothetical protein